MTAHGMALLAFGILQLVWVAVTWRRWTRVTMLAGIALSAGLVFLWTPLYTIPSSFAVYLAIHSRQFDWMLVTTKLLEVTVAVLLIAAYMRAVRPADDRQRWRQVWAPMTVVAATTGALLWVFTVSLPSLLPVFSASLRSAQGGPTVAAEAEGAAAENLVYDWRLPHSFSQERIGVRLSNHGSRYRRSD